MSRKRSKSGRRRSSSIGKARSGRVTPPKTLRAPVWLLFTDCPGCPLCSSLGVSDSTPYSEEPGAENSGSLFDRPETAGADLPWRA